MRVEFSFAEILNVRQDDLTGLDLENQRTDTRSFLHPNSIYAVRQTANTIKETVESNYCYDVYHPRSAFNFGEPEPVSFFL